MIDFIRYSRTEWEIVRVGVGASKARVAILTVAVALWITLAEDRAATVVGGRHRRSRGNSFNHEGTNTLAIQCGELHPEVRDCGSDGSVGDGGGVGEVLRKGDVLVQEVRVVGDVGDRERNGIDNQVSAGLEVLRESEENEIVVSWAKAFGVGTYSVPSCW